MTKFIIVLLTLLALVLTANAQWTHISTSPDQIVFDIAESDSVLYLGMHRIGVFKSTDSAATWESINSGLETVYAQTVNELLISGDTLWAATDDGIYRSENDGDNWTKQSNGIVIGNGAVHEFTLSIFEHEGSLFTGAWTGIYKSDDRGENWTVVSTGTERGGPKDFEAHNGILFAARETNNRPLAYRSTDNGNSWEEYEAVGLPTISFYSDDDNLWCTSIHGVALSTDDGETWTTLNEGLPPDPYNSDILRLNGYLYTSMEVGHGTIVLRSDDEGLFWDNVSEGMEEVYGANKILVFGDQMLVATHDGLWVRDTSMTVTNTDEAFSQIPESHLLLQTYPNPFNATTTFSFNLPRAAPVRLNLYNSVGQSVAELLNESLSPGSHSVRFADSDLPSGVYFVRLEAAQQSTSSKVILLK